MNLQRLIEQYISYQRSLGASFISDAALLRAFGRTRGPRFSVAHVQARHVEAFLGKARPVTRTWFTKLSCLRCFFRFAVNRGHIATVPLPKVMPKRPPVFIPYIYTREELRRLLQVAESHSRNICLEPATIRAMILVYYGAGLRLREATNLTRADVDLHGSMLMIRNTKFGKTGLVPVGPQLGRVLAQYDGTWPRTRPADAPFFMTKTEVASSRIRSNAFSVAFAIAQESAEWTVANSRAFTTCGIRSRFTVLPPGISKMPMYSDFCITCRSTSVTFTCDIPRCT